MKAVTLILKQATFLRISILSAKSALANAELNYQKAKVDVAIQQHLTACAAKQSVEQFVGFIMSTNIGLFAFLYHLSPQLMQVHRNLKDLERVKCIFVFLTVEQHG